MLTEKVAVVTGGGSGIGQACGIRFAKLGYRVCLMDIDNEKLNKVKQEINRIGHEEVLVLSCDVSSYEAG